MSKEKILCKLTYEHLDNNREMTEELFLTEDNFESDGKLLIEKFNDEERQRKEQLPTYKMDIRKFISIKKLEQKISYCDLKKLNIVSVKDSRGYYDLLECDSCLRIYKRYSLYTPTNLICNPKLICKKCRKEYKTEKGIGKHLELANCEAHPRR